MQRNPARKSGLTRKQVILLPRYSPRRPPSRQVGIVAKVNKLAEISQKSSLQLWEISASPNQDISSVDIPNPFSSDFNYKVQQVSQYIRYNINQSEQTWGLTTPEKPVPAPMDILSVYMVKQANSCFTRLAF